MGIGGHTRPNEGWSDDWLTPLCILQAQRPHPPGRRADALAEVRQVRGRGDCCG